MIDPEERAIVLIVWRTRYFYFKPNAFGFGSKGDSCTSGPALVGVLGEEVGGGPIGGGE